MLWRAIEGGQKHQLCRRRLSTPSKDSFGGSSALEFEKLRDCAAFECPQSRKISRMAIRSNSLRTTLRAWSIPMET